MKKRKCLKCNDEFTSESIYNRLCYLCKEENKLVGLVSKNLISYGSDINGNKRKSYKGKGGS